jgi:hypothetical protein
MPEAREAGPLTKRIAQGVMDFEARHGRKPTEIGLGFHMNVMLAFELGLPYDAEVVDFLGIRTTQPVDLNPHGVAYR